MTVLAVLVRMLFLTVLCRFVTPLMSGSSTVRLGSCQEMLVTNQFVCLLPTTALGYAKSVRPGVFHRGCYCISLPFTADKT